MEGRRLQHKFHVTPLETNIPYDGILGLDFLKKYEALVDCKNSQIRLEVKGKWVYIPLKEEGPVEKVLSLRARHISIHKVPVEAVGDVCVEEQC